MCPIRAICIIVKEFPDALITLQCGVFWQYDIMSELTNVDNSYTNVNNVWKNAPDKIFLYGKKGVVASPLIQYSVDGWEDMGKCVINYCDWRCIVQLLNTQPLV